MLVCSLFRFRIRSLSVRRAWIEISAGVDFAEDWLVALRKESVDRNGLLPLTYHLRFGVALRKESVDRNIFIPSFNLFWLVALRKESVDRNLSPPVAVGSLAVALRKESVDRNFPGTNIILSITASLSVRRAWIEI